jgi:purine-binding chemotaxis protein CheW
MSELQVVVFELKGQLFGAETSQVFQIIKYNEPEKMPKTPKFIDGILSYRDTVLPVINLAKRFDMGETAVTKKTKILVTRIGDKYAGFIVSDVTEIARFAEEDVSVTPSVMNRETEAYLSKVGRKGDKLISIVDLQKILSEAEIKKLSL